MSEEEAEELEGRLQTECDSVTVRGVVQGMVEKWGENQGLVEELRSALHHDYDHDVLSGKFGWINEDAPIRGPHCEARIHLKMGAQATGHTSHQVGWRKAGCHEGNC